MSDNQVNTNNYGRLTIILLVCLALIVLFFYLDRHNDISQVIWSWGKAGILLSILFMAAICMTPIPSEGLLIVLFKIFGIYNGAFYSWIGSILSALVIFYLARNWGQAFFRKMITPHRFHMVDHWILKRGSMGLFIARLLPIPAFAVNYITGVMPSVRLWPYIWTASLSIIPYYIGTALVYTGAARSTWIWLMAGGLIMFALWGISYILGAKTNNDV